MSTPRLIKFNLRLLDVKTGNIRLTMLGQQLAVELEQSVLAVHPTSADRQAGQDDRDHRLSTPLIYHSAEIT